MAGEADAYLEAYSEAFNALTSIKRASNQLASVAKSLVDTEGAVIPPDLPTVQQLTQLLERVKVAFDKAWQTYEQVPDHLRKHLTAPEDIRVD